MAADTVLISVAADDPSARRVRYTGASAPWSARSAGGRVIGEQRRSRFGFRGALSCIPEKWCIASRRRRAGRKASGKDELTVGCGVAPVYRCIQEWELASVRVRLRSTALEAAGWGVAEDMWSWLAPGGPVGEGLSTVFSREGVRRWASGRVGLVMALCERWLRLGGGAQTSGARRRRVAPGISAVETARNRAAPGYVPRGKGPRLRTQSRHSRDGVGKWWRAAARFSPGGATGLSGGEQSGGLVLLRDGCCEGLGDVCEVGVGTGDGAHAAAFADAVEFGDGVVELFPEVLGSAAAGVGLEFVGGFGAAAGGGPFVAVLVSGLAGLGALFGGVGERGEPGAELGVWWCEDVVAQRGAPGFAGFFEELFGVHRSASEHVAVRGVVRRWAVGLAQKGLEGLVCGVLPGAFARARGAGAEPVDLAVGDAVAVADPLGVESLGLDPVADGLAGRAERVRGLGDGQEVVVGH